MQFKFTIQPYQTDAADAVAGVFAGQPCQAPFEYVRDLGRIAGRERRGMGGVDTEALDLVAATGDDAGYANAPVRLTAAKLLDNIRKQQRRFSVPESSSLAKGPGVVALDVEMETGTGKTYAYTKTIFELNRRFGWTKFAIVVPSVAIREGVAKSLSVTEGHFFELYGKRIWSFVYNSARLNEIDQFAQRADISVMVINTQNFNKSMKEGGHSKEALIMFSERDDFGSRRPIDVLAATRPVIIMDEPQKMGGKATQAGIARFNPLFVLNYSATHRERHDLAYALDPVDAYRMRLVKRIEVKGFELNHLLGTDGYVRLVEIRVSASHAPRAVVEFNVLRAAGKVSRQTMTLDEGDGLYVASRELEAYREGYVIAPGGIVPAQGGMPGYVRFMNDVVVFEGGSEGDSAEANLRRVQIRETIKSHLEKEEALFRRGVKCLSLFFVDEVGKYRVYDEDGSEATGEYGRIFEEEYAAAVAARVAAPTFDDERDSSYLDYLRRFDASEVHRGYFSVDKKGRAVNSKVARGGEGSDDESAYDLILRNKERLLSFDEPCRFIFSHSALAEGWDNPNVFQICMLREVRKDEAKRQQVGRGLRLCVDQQGVRQDAGVLGEDEVQRVNRLTVVASEGYASFVGDLQKETVERLRARPRVVDAKLFCDFRWQTPEGSVVEFDAHEAQLINNVLVKHGLVDVEGRPTEKLREEGLGEALAEFDAELREKAPAIERAVRSVYDDAVLAEMVENGNRQKVTRNPLNANFERSEFQDLWRRINAKYAYTVSFDDDELVRKSVAEIDANLSVSTLSYTVTRGIQREDVTEDRVRGGEGFSDVTRETGEVTSQGAAGVTYDLVGEVAAAAGVTRRVAARILSGMAPVKFGLFRRNPEEFIARVGRLIVGQKAAMVVEHVSYRPTGESYDASIFSDAMPEARDKAYRASKNVQDWVFPDGSAQKSVERRFAEDLDAGNEVVVYAKLPRGFQIPTPVGNYAPDWAIAFDREVLGENVKHVFFVAETKGSLDSFELRGVERAKIACAKRLFNEINKSSNVHYEPVSTYQDLLDVLRGE